jgi:hypothetical protein
LGAGAAIGTAETVIAEAATRRATRETRILIEELGSVKIGDRR